MAAPPLPFPPGAGIPPPPPATMRMGAPPQRSSSQLPPSNVVLLTGVPEFLHPCLSNWILPCGPARTILWFPKQLDVDEKLSDTKTAAKKSMALVTMMHGDGAWKLVHTVLALKKTTAKNTTKFEAYMVPASPDIPLPEIELAEQVSKPLQEMMTKTYAEFEKNGGKLSHMTTVVPPPPPTTLDTQKVAAAAGGHNYDEDADPLNAPAVLQAVKDFRKSLQKTSTVQQARRIQLVQESLVKAMEARKKNGGPPPPPAANLLPPPPPLPTGVPPLGGLPPPPPAAADADSGKRGQSNLPAWMTTGAAAAAPTEPPAKKQKTDPATLRTFVAEQIKSLMGEEEATLIDFIVKHMTEEKPIAGLIEELQPVLEEDTNTFVQALQAKMKEL